MTQSSLIRRLRTFFVYVLLLHLVRVSCELLLPNAHLFNRIRGKVVGLFFAECGNRVAIASGCTFAAAWNLRVGDDVYIAHNCWLNAAAGLILEDGVILSPNVIVATTAHARIEGRVSLRESCQSPIKIGAGSWIAGNSVVTRGAIVEEGVIVGAGSVVRGTLCANSLYAGNPALFIKHLTD